MISAEQVVTAAVVNVSLIPHEQAGADSSQRISKHGTAASGRHLPLQLAYEKLKKRCCLFWISTD
jgi:hypothetical protein